MVDLHNDPLCQLLDHQSTLGSSFKLFAGNPYCELIGRHLHLMSLKNRERAGHLPSKKSSITECENTSANVALHQRIP
jgi:hypothetical protein